jgi:hypothetical protein
VTAVHSSAPRLSTSEGLSVALGYAGALTDAALVAVVFLALAWGVRWADGRLSDTDRSPSRV